MYRDLQKKCCGWTLWLLFFAAVLASIVGLVYQLNQEEYIFDPCASVSSL
jgi:hypothetical protein